MTRFDVVVIGAGPGGYVAAIRAAQLGFKTALVEREHLGGICLNWGCIPSKSLLRSADILRAARHGRDFGVIVSPPVFDIAQAVARSRKVSKQLNDGVSQLLDKNHVSVIWGQARIEQAARDGVEIDVSSYQSSLGVPQHPVPVGTLGEGRYTAKHVIIATGARPRVLPGLPIDETWIWSYFRALMPDTLPKSLIVVGSGAIGSEFASFYRDAGSEVLLIEMQDRILPAEDAEIAQLARRQFQKRGIRILAGARVTTSEVNDGKVSLTVQTSDGKVSAHQAERVISAAGVVANTSGLGLEALGVDVQGGCIRVDHAGRTNVPGVYAIGDVAGPPMLAHKAEHEGIACVETIAGGRPPAEIHVPACTFCHPNIASIGLSEEVAKKQGFGVKIGRFALRANGKAVSYGETDGMIKTVFDAQTGTLLGAQMVGAEVAELIGTIAMALERGTTLQQFQHTMFPHPTISEAIYESVLDAEGRAIHV